MNPPEKTFRYFTKVVTNHCYEDHKCSPKKIKVKVGIFSKMRELFLNCISRCSRTLKSWETLLHWLNCNFVESGRAFKNLILIKIESWEIWSVLFNAFGRKPCWKFWYNGLSSKEDWTDMNFQQNFNARHDTFQITNNSNTKVGRNIMCNRLTVLNNQIKLDWLNLSMTAFKLKAKSIFLTH